MSLPVSIFIALRYWRAKSTDRFTRIVTWLATFGIVLGVMALILVLSVMNGLENMQKNNVLNALPHAIITPLEGYLPAKYQLEKMPSYVKRAVPINESEVIMQSPAGLSAGRLLGISAFSDDPLLAEEEGKFKQLLPTDRYNIILSSTLAKHLELHVGDKVRILLAGNSQYTPMGRVPIQRLFTVSSIYYPNSGEGMTVFANISDVGRLLHIRPTQVEGMRLFLDDPFKVTELNQSFNINQWKIKDWRQQKGEFFQAVKMEKNMMGLLVGLIILVALCNIITSLSLMVVDKQREIAILQTQGLSKRAVMGIFISQGFLVGASGTIFGAFLGVVTTLNINNILAIFQVNNIYLPTSFDIVQVSIIIGVALLSSLLSTIYPAYKASRIEPAEALRYE